jgi:hypothetical protein
MKMPDLHEIPDVATLEAQFDVQFILPRKVNFGTFAYLLFSSSATNLPTFLPDMALGEIVINIDIPKNFGQTSTTR